MRQNWLQLVDQDMNRIRWLLHRAPDSPEVRDALDVITCYFGRKLVTKALRQTLCSSGLEELLQRRNQNYTDLANAVGTTPQSISRIASGKRRPSLEMAQRIAKALDASLQIVGNNFTYAPNNGKGNAHEDQESVQLPHGNG